MNWCLAAIVNHHYASPPSLSWLVTVNQCLLVLTNSIWFMAKRKAGRVLGVGCRTSFERTLVGVKSQLQLRQLWNAINPSGFAILSPGRRLLPSLDFDILQIYQTLGPKHDSLECSIHSTKWDLENTNSSVYPFRAIMRFRAIMWLPSTVHL